jgi:hypothetical protein
VPDAIAVVDFDPASPTNSKMWTAALILMGLWLLVT